MTQSTDIPSDVEKGQLWGWWRSHSKWRDELDKTLAYKALDIPEPDMIQANRVNGVGAGGMLVVGLLVALGPVLGVLLALWSQSQERPQPAAPPAASSPADADYEIHFYDQDGNPVRVDRWPGKPPDN